MLELKAAGAPISCGVSELARWGYRMAPERGQGARARAWREFITHGVVQQAGDVVDELANHDGGRRGAGADGE